MFWLRNKKIKFSLRTLNLSPGIIYLMLLIYRDHSAGNSSMKQRYSGIRIYGGAGDNVPDVTQYVFPV